MWTAEDEEAEGGHRGGATRCGGEGGTGQRRRPLFEVLPDEWSWVVTSDDAEDASRGDDGDGEEEESGSRARDHEGEEDWSIFVAEVEEDQEEEADDEEEEEGDRAGATTAKTKAKWKRREEAELRQVLRRRPPEYWDSHFHLPLPKDDQGYVVSFAPEESEAYVPFLKRYGFCIIRLLSAEECNLSIDELLKDAHEIVESKQRNLGDKAQSLARVDLNDPRTWELENWPYPNKFLFRRPAFGQQAFNNRTNEKLYHVFTQIYGETKLWCSLDRWGLMRGSKDLRWSSDGQANTTERPDWRWSLQPHWDWNPWLYQAMLDQGLPRMYQGILALDDCPEEVGGHITIPGSAAYLPNWVKEHKHSHNRWVLVSVAKDDAMMRYTQRIPMRKGDIIIWDAGQAHCNYPNNSPKCRIYQFIRMMPAINACGLRDQFSPFNVAKKYPDAKFWEHVQLTDLGRKLVGLDPWV